MENILAKIEQFVEKTFEELEKNPLKSSVKILVMYFLIRKALKWINEKV